MSISRGIGGVQEICTELVAIIHANSHVASSIYEDRARQHIYLDFASHHEEILKARTIEVAVNFRILDEGLSESDSYRGLKTEIETARIGKINSRDPALRTLREASNKIIHAKKLQFTQGAYTTHDPDTGRTYVNPCYLSTVVLTGTYYKNNWQCEIDLLIYAECVYEVLSRWVNGQFEPVSA